MRALKAAANLRTVLKQGGALIGNKNNIGPDGNSGTPSDLPSRLGA